MTIRVSVCRHCGKDTGCPHQIEYEQGKKNGKAEAIKEFKEFLETKVIPKYELACDWLGEPVSDKVNGVTAECLNFDILEAFEDFMKAPQEKKK